MAQSVDFTYRVYDNCLEIIPTDKVDNNAIYNIKIKSIKSLDNKSLSNIDLKVTTEMTPFYCSPEAIKIILEDFDIPESDILFFIRQASKQADYINGGPVYLDEDGNPPYVVEKYVEIKATFDALTKAYLIGNNEAGMEGTVGELTFKYGDSMVNLRKLLDQLRGDIDKWQDAIRGYEFAGRNELTFGLRASKTLRGTPANVILKDYRRNINLGKDNI